jgi:hypothetical protein
MTQACSAVLAYIDPGTGAMVLQVLLATVLGAGVMFRRFLGAPLAWFRKSDAGAATSETQPQDSEPDHRQAA